MAEREPVALDVTEQGLVDRIAERRDEIVALACELIAYDTTSRSEADEPARDEAPQGNRPSRDADPRAGRGLALVLRRPRTGVT